MGVGANESQDSCMFKKASKRLQPYVDYTSVRLSSNSSKVPSVP